MRHSSFFWLSLWFLHSHKSRDAFRSLGARISRDLWRIFAGICHTPRPPGHNSCHLVKDTDVMMANFFWNHFMQCEGFMTILLEITSLESLLQTFGTRFCDDGENERENERLKFYVRPTFDTFQPEAHCKPNKKVRFSPVLSCVMPGPYQYFCWPWVSQCELVMIMNITFTGHR